MKTCPFPRLHLRLLLHYSLSCIFTLLGRMCWAPSALACRKDSFFQYVKERASREQYPLSLLDGVVKRFLSKERCCFMAMDYKSAIPYNNSIQSDGTGLKISTSPWSVLIFANCNLISPHSYKAFLMTAIGDFFIRLNCPFKLIS